jgi:2-dehydropantoate 2-reductase
MRDANKITHTGLGSTTLGPLNKNPSQSAIKLLDYLQNAWKDIGVTMCNSNEIMKIIQTKIAVNACINPLTGILQCKNGHLKSDAAWRIMNDLCSEISPIFKIDSAELYENVVKVVDATGNNMSSMMVDVAEMRKTEIDYINGYLVEKGEELGLAVPYNKLLTDLIKLKTIKQ